MVVFGYKGTVQGFRRALREIRKAAMRGDKMQDPTVQHQLQIKLATIAAKDRGQGGEAT